MPDFMMHEHDNYPRWVIRVIDIVFAAVILQRCTTAMTYNSVIIQDVSSIEYQVWFVLSDTTV